MDEHSKVFITRTVEVHHQRKSDDQQQILLPLSNLDRKCPALMYLVFFYRPSATHDQVSDSYSLFSALKTGLVETLSTWYPAAGRLSLNPAKGKLDLLCDNSGALLVEATTNVKISELGDLSQYNHFFENLVFKPPFSGDFSEMPLVVAQLTNFGCGGYALGIGTSHSLFDGLANYNFLKAWASRTRSGEEIETNLVHPVHQRERLLVSHYRNQELRNLEKSEKDQVMRVIAFAHLYQLIMQRISMQCVDIEKLNGCNFSKIGNSSQDNFLLKTFHITDRMVGRLKSKAIAGISGGSCSPFEVVAAHLWKARTKALGISKKLMVCLQFTVDTRTRMSPPLPKGFAGNAYVLSSISCTAGELDQLNIANIVAKIKCAKNAVNEDYVRAYVEALEAPQDLLPPLPELTIISDWTRTPYHTIDFFSPGSGATYASPLAPPMPQVAYFMQSPGEEGGMHVRIGLAQEHLGHFTRCFFDEL